MDNNTNAAARDQNVLSFMMQLVQEKHGDDIDASFLNTESDRLYNKFGEELVSKIEPKLSEQDKVKFDEMIEGGKDQEEMMSFLVDSIPNLEEEIMNILIDFRLEYINTDSNNSNI